MIVKIKRQDALDRFPKFPLSDYVKEEYFYPEVNKTYRLIVDVKPVKQ